MTRGLEQLDSRTRIVTPENIAFAYRTAGPFSRVGAYALDVGIQIATIIGTIVLFWLLLLMVLASVLGGAGGVSIWEVLGNLGAFAIFVLWFLMQWFYGAYFEARWNGQTPGKRIVGLRVLQVDGRPITLKQAVLRNVMRLIDAAPMIPMGDVGVVVDKLMPLARGSHLVGLLSMSLTPRHQRLGDLVCGTMVVAEDQSRFGKVEPIDDPRVAELMETIPVNFVPNRSLSRAIAHYIGRRRYFGPARRQEIAKHIGTPLVELLGLPAQTDGDLLLCALYNRAFENDPQQDAEPVAVPETAVENPVQPAAPSPASDP